MECIEKESIKKFYEGAEIFITGGSGFIGKVLIEKLLRSCETVGTIHVLLRKKKNQSLSERLNQITDNVLFDTLKSKNAEALQKINIIEGDCTELRLGISDSDYEKLKRCSVIFHSAASVRFDDPLKKAILLNTRGTREICELARCLPNLKCFVHVSTAYIQPKNFHVEERLYQPQGEWRNFIKYAENLEDDLLDKLTKKLTRNAVNTYVFTKDMAEGVCNDYKNNYDLPITIYRPSIVSFTEFDPVTGWTDNFNGVMSVLIMAALGLDHVSSHGTARGSLVGVDLVVRGMLIAAWKTWRDGNTKLVPVYNSASMRDFDLEILRSFTPIPQQYFSLKAVSPNYGFVIECPFFAFILKLLLTLIPFAVVDGALVIAKKKPMLLKVQRMITNAIHSLSYFTKYTFQIDNEKFLDLNRELSKDEKSDFEIILKEPFYDITEKYYKHVVNNLFKETDADRQKAKRIYPLVCAYHYFFVSLYFYAFYKIISSLINYL